MVKQHWIVSVLTWFVSLAVLALAGGSFVLSYNALLALAIVAGGLPVSIAWLWPLVVDLSLCIYTLVILTSQLQRWPIWLPALLVVFYAGVTITGNVLHAPATYVGWFIAALPPLSLVLATETLRSVVKMSVERGALLASIADLSKEQQQLAKQTAALSAKIADEQQQLVALKNERYGTTDDTKSAARAILAERSDISGAELGRLLGKSDSLGRQLKRELLPVAGNVNGNNNHQNGNGVK